MKIYFEDGKLLNSIRLNFKYDFVIDAKNGYSFCKNALTMLTHSYPECIVYTNSIIALDNLYAWNDELGVPEIFMRAGEHQVFHRIDELTQKELHKAHNIMKMYMGNAFSDPVKE